MFTGIVEELGSVRQVAKMADGLRLEIACKVAVEGVRVGDSIMVNGACLTATRVGSDGFSADVSSESERVTTLGALQNGAPVHLERAMTLGGRLGGHLVTGHVDGVGQIRSARPSGQATELWFDAPPAVLDLSVVKGSVAVEGVSLTINGLDGRGFSVMIIPHTSEQTTLLRLPVGARVNLEADLIGKYVARLLGKSAEGGLSYDDLAKL